MKLDEISCQLSNIFRKKGTKRREAEEQFQPKYVKETKERAQKAAEAKKKLSDKDAAEMKAFWQKRNPKVKFL